MVTKGVLLAMLTMSTRDMIEGTFLAMRNTLPRLHTHLQFPTSPVVFYQICSSSRSLLAYRFESVAALLSKPVTIFRRRRCGAYVACA